jgi:molybdopterin-guanine dinucleotide biosynthesis protein A
MRVATPAEITGLVLAGGQGRRMGGQDKGLILLEGQAMAQRCAQRLAPQVQCVAISANRHLETYAAWGYPVWPDAPAEFAGPLAGFLAGLTQASTPWVVCVPCDSPFFPTDLVARLCAAQAQEGADVAVVRAVSDAHESRPQRQPVFCLLPTRLADDLRAFMAQGGRKIDAWLQGHACAEAVYPPEDAPAFFNFNRPEDLSRRPNAS